jgi:hypothetical protein
MEKKNDRDPNTPHVDVIGALVGEMSVNLCGR